MRASPKYFEINIKWIAFIFTVSVLISCNDFLKKDDLIDAEKVTAKAIIDRKTIGPKEKEIIHFKFDVKGEIYTGNEWVKENTLYKVGDSLFIDYANSDPSLNRISK